MTVDELKKKVPVGSLVKVTLDESVLKPDSCLPELIGWWDGVKPNPNINPMILDPHNAWHWMAMVVDLRANELIYDIHLAGITNIDINPEP